MTKKRFSPRMAGGLGCLAGVAATQVVLFLALVVFIVVWGNKQDWYPAPAEDAGKVEAADSLASASHGECAGNLADMLGSMMLLEVNETGYDAQLQMHASDDDLIIRLSSLYEVRLEAFGKIESKNIEATQRGFRMAVTLKQYQDDRVEFSDDVTMTLEERDDNLYDLSFTFKNEPSESAIRNLEAPCRMYAADLDEWRITGEVPFRVNKDRPLLKDILAELFKYRLSPELFAINNYIKKGCDATELDDTEQVRIDQRDLFFSYSLGMLNQAMEGRCMKMADGCILLVTDRHDATYEHEQYLDFYIIDPAAQTITQRPREHFLPTEWTDRGDAIFQVRRATNGLVAVFDDGKGGLDAKTLKFDGRTFK